MPGRLYSAVTGAGSTWGPGYKLGGKPMPDTSGRRLGPYEILSAIGAGGMGEVYQAHDTKLGRERRTSKSFRQTS